MEDAEARRARLRALKEAAELLQQPETGGEEGQPEGEAREEDQTREERRDEAQEDTATEAEDAKGVTFRNYIPRDEALGKQKLPPAPVPKLKEPESAESALLENDDPISAIAPRKENWDLRRDVEKRLQKLERRTQRAMIQLMREEEERRSLEEAAAGGGDDEENGDGSEEGSGVQEGEDHGDQD